MYVRTVTRKTDVSYIQLAHNMRDKKAGQVKANVLYNFNRADQLNVRVIRRLLRSLSRFLPPEEALQDREGVIRDSSFSAAVRKTGHGYCGACGSDSILTA